MNYRERVFKNYTSTHFANLHSFSKEEYSLFAKVYKKRFGRVLPNSKDAKILDVACGAGHFLFSLQKDGYTDTQGIDISDEQLEVARKAGVKNVIKADLFEYLSGKSETFDVIAASDIIEHLHKDEVLEMLDIFYSSIKPGGTVIISTLNADRECLFQDITHETGLTPLSISQVMRLCKFADVKVYGEKPVIHDFRSLIRSILWSILKFSYKTVRVIEKGTGRGFSNQSYIYERRMFAVGHKK